MKERLNSVLYTLNQITVSGEQNLDMLLGCILQLKQMVQEIDNEKHDNNE